MILREAHAGDLAAIVELLADDGLGRGREAPGDPAYAAAFRRMREQPGNLFLVAEDAGAIVGCLQLTIIHGLSRRGASRAQIEGVRVAAGRRGTGLGRAMLAEAIERARAAGCSLVQLTTDRRREDGHRFYEGLGFRATHLGMKLEL